MIRLLADENFNGDIVQGLVQRSAELDIVRVQDVGLAEAGRENEWENQVQYLPL